MQSDDARALLLHQVQACLHSVSNGTDALHHNLGVLTDQCSAVMASNIHALDAAIQRNTGILDSAVRAVFADMPRHCVWRARQGYLGCYVSLVEDQVYSINICTGIVLCNGDAPGHLPATILQHSTYQQLFGNASFEVARQVGERQGTFQTVQSHAGCFYTFVTQGRDLVVTECPVRTDTGGLNTELELELLPCPLLHVCLPCLCNVLWSCYLLVKALYQLNVFNDSALCSTL